MTAQLPWFKCQPAKLLGALGALSPSDGYLYTVLLLRIYESGGPVFEDASMLARRTGMTRRAVESSLISLINKNKVQRLENGALDCCKTHGFLADRETLIKNTTKAGKTSAEKRAEKAQSKQQTDATSVEQEASYKDLDTEQEKKDSSLRSLSPAREIASQFDEFYAAYPKHVDPKAAKAKFLAVVRAGADPGRIVSQALRFAEAHRLALTDKQFIPAPAVWLNRGGYDSEDLPTAPARAGPRLNGFHIPANPEKSVHAAAQRLSDQIISGELVITEPPKPYLVVLTEERERARQASLRLLPEG